MRSAQEAPRRPPPPAPAPRRRTRTMPRWLQDSRPRRTLVDKDSSSLLPSNRAMTLMAPIQRVRRRSRNSSRRIPEGHSLLKHTVPIRRAVRTPRRSSSTAVAYIHHNSMAILPAQVLQAAAPTVRVQVRIHHRAPASILSSSILASPTAIRIPTGRRANTLGVKAAESRAGYWAK